MRKVSENLDEENLALKISKCDIFRKRGRLVRPSPIRVRNHTERGKPYRFIPTTPETGKPKEKTEKYETACEKFEWGEEQTAVFESIKNAVANIRQMKGTASLFLWHLDT